MNRGFTQLPFPVLDALPCGAHRLVALTDPALFDACGVRVLFTGRAGGVSVGDSASLNTALHVSDNPDAVHRNRQLVLAAANAEACPLIVPNQVHGTNIVTVSESGAWSDEPAAADAVAVQVPDVAVLLNFADCLPLVVVSPSGRFAVVHAGWRGAVAGIAGKAVRALAKGDSCSPADYNAYIGPHIHAECFEVGAEVEERFRAAFGNEAVPMPRHVSLATAVSADLTAAGLTPRRIADANICTKCHPDQYFSYRATNGTCGRQAAFAVATRHRFQPVLDYPVRKSSGRGASRCARAAKGQTMTTKERYEQVATDLAQVCRDAGRSPEEVTLVAVSKTVGPDDVALAIQGGARDFGENRPDQLVSKADQFTDARWHFIGNIQSRRIRDIVGRATLIHSLFEERHAVKIDQVARDKGIVQDVLLEVNVSGEESKSGCAPANVAALLNACRALPNVRVRGLMTMAPRADEQAVHQTFSGLAQLRDQLRAELPPQEAAAFSELSMGMSEDWRAAVAHGATIVRIGRAIFSDQF